MKTEKNEMIIKCNGRPLHIWISFPRKLEKSQKKFWISGPATITWTTYDPDPFIFKTELDVEEKGDEWALTVPTTLIRRPTESAFDFVQQPLPFRKAKRTFSRGSPSAPVPAYLLDQPMPRRRRRKRARGQSIRTLQKRLNAYQTRAKYPRGSNASISRYGPSYRQIQIAARSADPDVRGTALSQMQNRAADRFVGDGDYRSFLRGVSHYGLRGLGALGGAYAGRGGGIQGMLSGAKTGFSTGAGFSRFVGSGDYDLATNQIIGSGASGPNRQALLNVDPSNLSGDIVYSNHEFVKNIYASIDVSPGTSSFEIEAFPLNPGIASSFPFLSQLAQNFELFEFNGLMFQYKPTSGEFGNNSSNSLGKVVLCTNYDPDADPFKSSVEMENYDYACSTKPAGGCLHGVETAVEQRATNQLYVRTGDSTKSRIFTDLGNFYLATEGVPFGGSGAQSALVGELWVSYQIKLSRSKLFGSFLGRNIPFVLNSGVNAVDQVVDSTGSDPASSLDATFGTSFGTPNGLLISFGPTIDAGRYIMLLYNTSPAVSNTRWFVDSLTNCTSIGGFSAPESTLPSQDRVYTLLIEVNAQGPTNTASIILTTGGSLNPLTAGSYNYLLTQVSDQILN